MQKNANDIGNGKNMQLTMYAQVRLGCTIHIFIIGVDALKGCVESARRTEEGRRDDAWRPTKRNVWPRKKKSV